MAASLYLSENASSTLKDCFYPAQSGHIPAGITVDGDEVGEFAGLERAQLVAEANRLGGDSGRRFEHLTWRHTAADHQLEIVVEVAEGEVAATGVGPGDHARQQPGL